MADLLQVLAPIPGRALPRSEVPDPVFAAAMVGPGAAFRGAVHQAGLQLEVAVRLASTSPAGVLGLGDVGAIEAGKRADLVVLDQDLRVAGVMAAGAWVQDAES